MPSSYLCFVPFIIASIPYHRLLGAHKPPSLTFLCCFFSFHANLISPVKLHFNQQFSHLLDLLFYRHRLPSLGHVLPLLLSFPFH